MSADGMIAIRSRPSIDMTRLFGRALVLLLVVALLAACGHSRVVKREGSSRSERPARSAPAPARGSSSGDSYVVQRGDTLYGIAFRHGLDYREVAGWNRIPAPYTIYPGQRLSLRGKSDARPTTTAGAVTGMPAPARPTPSGPAVSTPLPPVTAPATTPATGPATVATTPAATSTAPATTPATTTAPTPTPVAPSAVSAAGWRWPAKGQLIGRFAANDPKRQGIDIAGSAGQPVFAAADGVVVYSGAGLVGYGELIIVKHSDEWLSAYAHNRRRLVTEGTAVKGGQQIAELGRSGTSRDMLHFEVRRNGKPVDPLQVLPPP